MSVNCLLHIEPNLSYVDVLCVYLECGHNSYGNVFYTGDMVMMDCQKTVSM